MKIYYYLTKSKRHRIQLESRDVYTLLFLNEQSILSQPQLYEFHSFFTTISEAAFRRKMSRWNDANIINKRKVKMVNGYELAIIELTVAGQNLLKKLSYLNEDEKLKYQAKSNLDHTLAIKQSVIEVLRNVSDIDPFYIADGGKYIIPFREEDNEDELEQTAIIFKNQNSGSDFIPPIKSRYSPDDIEKFKKTSLVQSLVPQDFEHIKEHLGKGHLVDRSGLKPDWIFKVKDTFIYIEVDSGSEKIKTKRDHTNTIIDRHDIKSIEGKLYRYQELAKSDTEHEHKVIFTLMDNSDAVITTDIHSNKDIRIANLKHDIAHMNDYNNWSIDIYVTGMKRFYSVVKSIYLDLFNKEDFQSFEKYKQVFIALVKAGLKPEWTNLKLMVVPQHSYQKLGLSTNRLNFTPNFLFRYFQETGYQHEQFFVPLLMREGSVKDMELLDYYSIPVGDGRFKYNAKILALYETREELLNDILRKTMKVTVNKMTEVIVDNNGMDTNNIVFAAMDEINEGHLGLCDSNRKLINKSQLF